MNKRLGRFCDSFKPLVGGNIMGWSVGYDDKNKRDVGYGVPAVCDHPDCSEEINRGLGYVCCDQQIFGGEEGCGLFFCSKHSGPLGMCERCENEEDIFKPKPDTEEWINHKLTDESWADWRAKNPDFVNTSNAKDQGRVPRKETTDER